MKESRARARVVCTRCHERKVRCDLGDKTNGAACRNCQREQCPCQRYSGIRKRRLARSPAATITRSADALGIRQEGSNSPTVQSLFVGTTGPRRSGYFGTQSILSVSDATPEFYNDSMIRPHHVEAILSITDATRLPSATYRKALQDFYFQHLYPVVPVLQQDEPCLLLQQTMCFAGSIMRRPNDHPKGFAPEEIYARIKALLFLGLESDILSVLKTYCVLACWTPLSSHVATLDHPWHWAGTATRLAIQLGLHKESTHLTSQMSSQSRNIWWHLFCSDTLQATCFGRPPMIRSQDFDVALPNATSSTGSLIDRPVMIQLMMNLSVIAMMASRQQDIELAELQEPLQNLQDWVNSVPPERALFDLHESQTPHDRWAVEIHIYYFVSIILIYLLPGSHRQISAFHSAAVLASSCAIRLFEAMLYRDELNFLNPIHPWLAFVAAIPQSLPLSEFSPLISREEIELIQSTLRQLSTKHSGAKLCLCKLEDLQKRQAAKGSATSMVPQRRSTTALSDSTLEKSLVESLRALFPFPDSISPRMPELRSQLTTSNQEDADWSCQPFLPEDEVNFEWADLNFDSFGFYGSESVVTGNAPSFASETFYC